MRKISRPDRLAASTLLALALAACGSSVPQIHLASSPPASQPGAPAASQSAPASPAEPTATPDTTQAVLSQVATIAAGGHSPSASAAANAATGQAPSTQAAGSLAASQPPSTSPAGGQAISAQPTGRTLPAGERLVIPSIGVNAPMITLGVDDNGVMQVPNNGTDVGWYTFSAVPGMAGNAVISGHLDTTTSTTAVFTHLKDLKQGDKVALANGNQETDYQVFWTKAWTDDAAPLALILGNAPSPTLTLITCAGTWDKASSNYSERLVVRAKLPGSI